MQGYKISPQVQSKHIGTGSQPSPAGLEDSSAYSCFKVGVEEAYQFPTGETTQGHIKCHRVMEISHRFSIHRVVSYCRVTTVQVLAVL